MQAALLTILLLLSAFGIWGVGKSVRNRQRHNWRIAAQELGLTFFPGGMLSHDWMNGRHDGLEITVQTFGKGSGKNRRTYTRIVEHRYVDSPYRHAHPGVIQDEGGVRV